MKKINAIILLSSLTSASVFAGVYVENGGTYDLASNQGEVMPHVGYNFDMGAGIMLTNTYDFQREDEPKHRYNEIEGWYPLFKPTDKLTIQPGGLVSDKSIGSGGAVYLDVNYKSIPQFNLTIRNRYNHNNYSSTGLSGELDNNDTYKIDTYWNFKVTDKFSYTFEPHYSIRVNDFNSNSGKDYHWEITNTFHYRIDEHWLPCFELHWLDCNVEPYHREQSQIRIRTKYFFWYETAGCGVNALSGLRLIWFSLTGLSTSGR